MKVGLISDTHGHLEPRVLEWFAGVEHILHAGDIGDALIIHELETIAPVTAVAGNNDFANQWPERQVVELAGWRFLVQHIVDPRAETPEWKDLLARAAARVVVFGHTHRPLAEWREGRLFINPGYAGRPRLGLQRSVALLGVERNGVQYQFLGW
jgi:putative phosphoesterase